MPFLPGLPFGAGSGALLDVDFTSFAAGFHDASSFQTAMAGAYPELSLVRCYTPQTAGGTVGIGDASGAGHNATQGGMGETVQVSPTSLLASAQTNQTNIACIGNRTSISSKRGLVIQAAYANLLYADAGIGNLSYRRCNSAGYNWTGGTNMVSTVPFADSPDGSGTGCTRLEVAASPPNAYSPYSNPYGGVQDAFTWSWWSKGTAQTIWHDGTPGTGDIVDDSVSTWKKLSISKTTATNRIFFVPAATELTLATADVLDDYFCWHRGGFARECIPTVGGVRPGERVVYSNGAKLVAANGQIKVYARLSPMHASTMAVAWDILQTALVNVGSNAYVAGWYLFSWGPSGTSSTSYAYVRDSDKKLVVKIEGGSEYVSTNAMSFAADDEIEIYVAVGSNVASVAKYRVVSDVEGTITGAAYTDLILATVPDVPAPGANPVGLFHDMAPTAASADTGQFTCRAHHLTVFGAGAPMGVA